jgi:DNA invertase Pin-like site-specific DNA recombinase
MLPDTAASKVTAAHLSRQALLYIRQSSLKQVIHNTESAIRQYDLRGKAISLGWAADQITVIDIDQGHSGASAADREGFQQLVAEVSLGRAGIVLGLECSRLARNSADWHQLLELCGMTGTLICDEDGLYDPRNFNDRLLLGMKGQMSEAELHFIRARLRGGIISKARRGELITPLPVGLAYDAAGHVILDPDTAVRKAVAHLFATFAATGSATACVKAFNTAGLSFPWRHRAGPRKGEIDWKPLAHHVVLRILHNPRYAGAFTFGRHRDTKLPGGKLSRILLPRQEWISFIPGAHPGYITLDQYDANRARLTANAAAHGSDRTTGPPREGPALLQGIIICGTCGQRMTVRYHQRRDQQVPTYVCQRDGIEHAHRICQAIPGAGLDQQIGQLLIDTLTPLAIEAALTVTAELEHRAAEADALRAAHVERARYHADLARRRYLAVDPANRLVAGTLEADWNTALRALSQAQDASEQARKHDTGQLTDAQHTRIRQLATDLPAIWDDPATPPANASASPGCCSPTSPSPGPATPSPRTSAFPRASTPPSPCPSRRPPPSSAKPPPPSSPPSMSSSITTPTPRSPHPQHPRPDQRRRPPLPPAHHPQHPRRIRPAQPRTAAPRRRPAHPDPDGQPPRRARQNRQDLAPRRAHHRAPLQRQGPVPLPPARPQPADPGTRTQTQRTTPR